jgi:2-polyprenyl-3-methyl-5-hydroxy-6-metoxy-1,4-benzoquinol methylase
MAIGPSAMEKLAMSAIPRPPPLCRHCSASLDRVMADLGTTPVANDYIEPDRLNIAEPLYPLRAFVCQSCWLVQLEDFVKPNEVFSPHYAYQSSMSESWLEHARRYAIDIIEKLALDAQSHVVEIASNDGYLLQYFKSAGVRITGIEPAQDVARIAREKRGISTIETFFSEIEAKHLLNSIGSADLIIANNVLAHVPNINDFVSGVRTLLKPNGTATFEFPHVLNLLKYCQFDTIYHEHFSYLSLIALEAILARAELKAFHGEELATHGGSLRVYVTHRETRFDETSQLQNLRKKEHAAQLDQIGPYLAFSARIGAVKRQLIELLNRLKVEGKTIAAYGAPAKGNTLLNYCGIGRELIDFTVDRAPSKQGKVLPGSRIPILSPDAIAEHKPDYVLILPWNLTSEITKSLHHIRAWGGQCIVPIPTPRLLDWSGNAD